MLHSTHRLKLAWLLICCVLMETATHARDVEPVRYTVSLPAPQTQMVEIAMEVSGLSQAEVDFALPIWRPGRYFVVDPAATVRQVRAFAGDESLPIRKIDKSRWRVSTGGSANVRLHYRVYANSIADRTRHVDDTHAFLSGAAVFMYVPELRATPCVVHIKAPDGWRVASGLEPLKDEPFTLSAANYDVLVDSPLEIGVHDVLRFEAAGKPHEIVIWGNADYDAEQLKNDFAKIVEAQAAFFGRVPYERYVFILHVGAGASGGTEHLNSTVMQVSRAALEEPDSYRRLLSLASHEFFHTWNVKQFRPVGIHPYDYQRENYSELFWLVEGGTTYYTPIMLVRAGLLRPDDYLRQLADAIDGQRRRPGDAVQSAAEASFDAWLHFGRSSPDDVNATVSFYTKGAQISAALDMLIRRHSNHQASMDDLMRALFNRFPLDGPGYTSEDVRKIAEELAGVPLFDFFDQHIHGTEPLNLEDLLQVVGLELFLRPTQRDGTGEDGELPTAAYLGLNLSDQGGRAVVSSVLADGPAYHAGLQAGDEVLAIDGRRLGAGDLNRRLRRYEPGQMIAVSYFRRDELRTVHIELHGRPDARWSLRRVRQPTDEQKAAFQSWLGQPWR